MTSLWKPSIGSDDISRFDVGVTWTRMADGFCPFVAKSPVWNILVPRDSRFLLTWSWNEGPLLVRYKLSRVALGTRMGLEKLLLVG